MSLLQGLKVIDLSRVLAGPFACQVMGDLGAEVIKVEKPSQGDDTRQWGPPYFEGKSAYYLSANRNKKSVCVDFGDGEQLSRLKSLISSADILVENFKLGSLKKFGLDYESLRQLHPGLIYCSIQAFDHKDQKMGYDILIQAMAGLMSITGREPTKVGVATTDLCTGLYGVIGVLAAVYERARTGEGRHIELSLFDSQVSLLSNVLMNYLVTNTLPTPQGNSHASIVPYQSFECRDGSIIVAIGNDSQFQEFCQILGKSWHEDPRFNSNPNRVQNRELLCNLIEREFREKTKAQCLELFSDSDLAIGPVNNLEELHREAPYMFTKMDDDKTACIQSPFRISGKQLQNYRKPPDLGADQREYFS